MKKTKSARSPDAVENILINLAIDVAEKQLRNGTASSQVITHFLKLASSKERLEKQRLQEEVKLLRSKTENMETNKNIETLYAEALNAMSTYGTPFGDDEDDEELY